VLPLAKIALKAHALGDLEARDDSPLDLLAGLSGCFAGAGTPSWTDRGEKQIGRARRVPIEGGPVAFRESLWPVVSAQSGPLGSYRDISRYSQLRENTSATIGGFRRTLYEPLVMTWPFLRTVCQRNMLMYTMILLFAVWSFTSMRLVENPAQVAEFLRRLRANAMA
jgi:hypothetical protein